ncbi:MAG TPA: DUF4342 domain-containing protein [Chloroflexota bacterium]
MSNDRGRSTTDQLVDFIKQVIHEGNIRDVVFTGEGGRTTCIPLTIAVVAVLIFPPLLFIALLLVFAQSYSISIQNREDTNGRL